MDKLWRKIATYIFHSNKIFVQLVTFILLVSIIPVIVISSLLFNRISGLAENTLNESHSQLVAQYMSNMNENFFRYRYRVQQIANNTIVIDELLNQGSNVNPYVKGTKVSIEVSKCLGVEDYSKFRNCMVYSNVKDAKIYGDKVSMMEEANREQWYANSKALKKGIISYLAVDQKTKVLSLIEDIFYIDITTLTKQYIGFVKLDINSDKLFAPVKEKTEEFYSYDIMVLDEDNDLIYCSNNTLIEQLEEILFEDLDSKSMLLKNNNMIYGDTIEPYGIKVIFLFESDLFTIKKEELQKYIMPMIFILVGFITITTYLFTINFSKRVERLVHKIKLAEEGNFTVTEQIIGNDEIAILDKQFNRMLKRVNNLIQKNYIQQLEKKESELKTLQLQINPHFLYNTLETISSLAAIRQIFDICDLCEKLGEIFRYSLGKNYGEYVMLEQELRHIKNYIFIQQARFGSKFNVFYNVEADIMQKQVLRFILQPIVENAIIHGLSMKPTKGKLEISVVSQDEYILIKIEDDGVGMTPERLSDINEYINASEVRKEDKKRSIGIRNVNQRIKLSYGSSYGIIIQSELNHGSCFIIRLPFVQ